MPNFLLFPGRECSLISQDTLFTEGKMQVTGGWRTAPAQWKPFAGAALRGLALPPLARAGASCSSLMSLSMKEM